MSYTKSFVSLWEEFVEISYVHLLFVVREEDSIGFSWFFACTFPVVCTLLLEVFGVVLFCICK